MRSPCWIEFKPLLDDNSRPALWCPVRIVEARSPGRVVDQINYISGGRALAGALEEPFLDPVAAQAGRFQRSSMGTFSIASVAGLFSAGQERPSSRDPEGRSALARSRTGTCDRARPGHDEIRDGTGMASAEARMAASWSGATQRVKVTAAHNSVWRSAVNMPDFRVAGWTVSAGVVGVLVTMHVRRRSPSKPTACDAARNLR
jgi:hypothetical protein